jgi:Sulfotransferase family
MERLKNPLSRPAGTQAHFRFSHDGRHFAYCRIRKNGCSAMQRFVIATSPQRGLEFLRRHHAVASRRTLDAADGKVLIVRDPVERLKSVYANKFLQRKNCADIFASYRAVTGRAPQEASFEAFVFDYVARLGTVGLDPHVWPQSWHLCDTLYDHVFRLEALRDGMAGIIGWRLARRFFHRKINRSPPVELAVPGPVEAEIVRLYAEDIAMLGRIRSR